ncbi:MAG: SMC-Scp complex subunit ScpB, partial [Pirellulales bacterium]
MLNQPAELGRILHSPARRYRRLGCERVGGTGSGTDQNNWRRVDAVHDSVTDQEHMARLEAVLFLSKEPLTSRKLAQLANLSDGTAARTLVGRLNRMFDARSHAFRVEQVAGGYQFLTRPKFSPWLRRMAGSPPEFRLSGPSIETLAVIAYRQPVLRAEIEAVRGVQCGEMVRQLMERGMVRITGRADELGRPFLYGTTRIFLQVFGLRNLDELPRASMLRRSDDESVSGLRNETAESEVHEAEADQCEENKESAVLTTGEITSAEKVAEFDDDDLNGDDFDDGLDDDDDDDDDALGVDDDDFKDEEWQEVEDESD